VRDALAALDPIVDHACAVLAGHVTEHAEPGVDVPAAGGGAGGATT
jgi:hypothetical protein